MMLVHQREQECMLLWVHPLMKLFVLIVSPSVSFLFEITILRIKIRFREFFIDNPIAQIANFVIHRIMKGKSS